MALELLYDYLDGLSERPHADPLGEGERLYATFVAGACTGAGAGEALTQATASTRRRRQRRRRALKQARALTQTHGEDFCEHPARIPS